MNAYRLALPLALALPALTGCGGTFVAHTTFSMSFEDNDAAQLRAALPTTLRRSHATGDVSTALSADGTSLLAFDAASGNVLHRTPVTTTYPLITAGELVVVEEAAAARVIDPRTGRVVLRVELSRAVPEEHVIGADADGSVVVLSVVAGSGATARSRLVIAQDGDIEEEVDVDRPIGVPAVAGSTVFVPWAYQFLSVFDLDGEERARIRLRTNVVGQAMADADGVWFGGDSVYRLGADSADESHPGYTPPPLPVDRAPNILPNAYEPPATLSSAAHHVRLFSSPDRSRSDGAPADSVLYLAHYRFVFALEATTGIPRWVRNLPADAIGGFAFPGGVRVVAEDGTVLTLDAATGRAMSQSTLGERVSFAAFPRLGRPTTSGYVESERPDVRTQLLEAVQLADARLITGREFALSRLAMLEDDDATADLGLLCEDERLPARTKARACELLSNRPIGEEHVRTQLARHGSFLEERPHPPVLALARAAGTMHDSAAVDLLVAQLADVRTPTPAIAAIAESLLAIGDARAVPALRDFIALNHTDASEEGSSDALTAVANAYARLGGAAAIADLEACASDPMTPAALIRALREPAFRVRTEQNAAQAAASRPAETAPAAGNAPQMAPAHLTHELAEPILAEAHAQLAECLDADPSRPGSARVIVVVRRTGGVVEVHATPSTMAPCLRNRMQSLHFPATAGPGDTTRLTFTLRP